MTSSYPRLLPLLLALVLCQPAPEAGSQSGSGQRARGAEAGSQPSLHSTGQETRGGDPGSRPTPQKTRGEDPGWTSLFNGKDFTGWRISKPESFRIEDGAIVANGPASHAFYDGPFRNHTFRNFELKVDVMARPNGNGGVYVLTQFEERGGNARASGDFPSKGFEIQVNNTYARDPVKTGSLYHVQDVTEAPVKDDEWFTMDIVVKGETITVRLNDKQVVAWTQPADWNGGREGPGRSITPSGGTIALQAHDPGSTVFYKNIRIKPLD